MFKSIARISILFLFTLVSACSSPQSSTAIQAGKDYQIIPSTLDVKSPPPNKIKVIEFFSFGCPWCFKIEPDLEKWLAVKGDSIEFERIPVTFEAGWDVYAKAYYTAKNLGVDQKIILPFFDTLQKQGVDLTDTNNLEHFFVTQGVSGQDFESAFNFTPGIDAQLMQGDKTMRGYGVYSVPSFVVNGKYVTNMAMAGGNTDRIFKIVDYMINKAKSGE